MLTSHRSALRAQFGRLADRVHGDERGAVDNIVTIVLIVIVVVTILVPLGTLVIQLLANSTIATFSNAPANAGAGFDNFTTQFSGVRQ